MPKVPQLTIRVSPEEHKQLRRLAVEKDFRSLNALGRDIILRWLREQVKVKGDAGAPQEDAPCSVTQREWPEGSG